MADEREIIAEELLRSAAPSPPLSIGFRNRVLRAAKKAQQRATLRRRIRYSAGLVILLLLLGAGVAALRTDRHDGPIAEPPDRSSTIRPSNFSAGSVNSKLDWDQLEPARRQAAPALGTRDKKNKVVEAGPF